MARGRTLLACRIGGRQTVQNYQHSPTSCVQCALTHSTLAHLSVSLASSRQLSTNDRCSSRVCRSEGEGEEWVRGFGYFIFSRLLAVYNYQLSYTCGNPSEGHMPSNGEGKESRFSVNNRLLITSKHRFRNRVTRRVLQSIISDHCPNEATDCTEVLQKTEPVNMARSCHRPGCAEDGVGCHPTGSFTHGVKFSLPIPIGRMVDGEVGVSW